MRLPALRQAVAAGAVVILAAAVGTAAAGPGTDGTNGTTAPPRILWGIGDQLGPALGSSLYRHGVAHMVTAWFNGPGDLDWMSETDGSAAAGIYAAGGAVELVVWLDDDPQYAISTRFQSDIRLLTRLHKGSGPDYGPLYVVLFTELETYSGGDPAYRTALLDAYRRAVVAIHEEYSGARVALGFGGYGWDGVHDRDLTAYRDAIAVSDFVTVQQMQPCEGLLTGQDDAAARVRTSVRQLGRYGKPVMISHFKLWGDERCQREAFERFTADVFTAASLRDLVRDGLFAWGFMADDYINEASPRDAAVRRIATYRAGLRHRGDLPSAGVP
ncbi:hypothetical protein [Actinoplanes sp. NPDC049316]|uniref:hypothetical protein n=1 Tax=Actinoplanes sp. NPDC049316 TaxID=3154727 RepID=UPI00341623DE